MTAAAARAPADPPVGGPSGLGGRAVKATWPSCAALLVLVSCAGGADESGAAGAGPTATQPTGPCGRGQAPLEEGGCAAVGVAPEACAEGFEPDGRSGCQAILPAGPCELGRMAIPGETACREVAPCGEGRWGSIALEPDAELVDGAYEGPDSDGSEAKPWKTIQEGLDAASPGALVAVAAGSYAENLLLDLGPVRLVGRCPQLVELVGSAGALAALELRPAASGSEVRSLAVRGGSFGIGASGAVGVVLDALWIHDTQRAGLTVDAALGETSVRLSSSLLELVSGAGVRVSGAEVTIDASVVRDVQPDGDLTGRGIDAERGLGGAPAAALAVHRSIVERARERGVCVSGSAALLEGVVVRGTIPIATPETGEGIYVERDGETGERGGLTLRGSVVADNALAAVFVEGSDALIESTVLRDTELSVGSPWAVGLVAQSRPGLRASVRLEHSLVERGRGAGVVVIGSEATVDSTLVRDIEAGGNGAAGRGFQIQSQATSVERAIVLLRQTAVENATEVGVFVVSSDATLAFSAIRDTRAAAGGSYGDGLGVLSLLGVPASATAEGLEVRSSARAAIAAFGATVSLAESTLACNGIDLDAETYESFPASFGELANDACGCEGESWDCAVESSGLAPPTPPVL